MLTTRECSKGSQKQSSTVRKTSGRGYPAPVRKYLEHSSLDVLSVHEELRAMHDELQSRYAELANQHAQWTALLASIPAPVVLIGSDLTVAVFNIAASEALNLTPHDRQRGLSETALSGLVNIVAHAIDTGLSVERDVQSPLGRWCSITIRPFSTRSKSSGGALVIWSDIDTLFRSRESERALLADAERASESTDAVLRFVTAELQTPLQDLRSFIALLRSGPLNESEYRDTLETIERQTDTQRRRVDELLADERLTES
jgi:signal transduction histidine kinase